jgi:hypothetical protein
VFHSLVWGWQRGLANSGDSQLVLLRASWSSDCAVPTNPSEIGYSAPAESRHVTGLGSLTTLFGPNP